MQSAKAIESGNTHLHGEAHSAKKGFTLIELLVVLMILAILIGIVIVSVTGMLGRGWETGYTEDRQVIWGAVLGYWGDPVHHSSWPTADGQPGLIIMEELTAPVGIGPYLQNIPRSAHDDNCTGTCNGHYKWFVTGEGMIYSRCVDLDGGECEDTLGDGYQGIFP